MAESSALHEKAAITVVVAVTTVVVEGLMGKAIVDACVGTVLVVIVVST